MWIEGRPNIPLDEARLAAAVAALKNRFRSALLAEALPSLPCPAQDSDFWPEAVYAALAARRYGVIYWQSRIEARSCLEACARRPGLADLIRQAAEAVNGVAERVVNRAVVRYLTCHEVRLQVTTAPLLARHAIASTGRDAYLVRTADFVDWHTGALERREAMFDLHDFAHQVCAAVDPDLFGNKYHPALAGLPAAHRRLVTSPNRDSGRGSPFADGLVFSELLNDLYHDLWPTTRDSGEIVARMASRLCAYYAAEQGIRHPSSGAMLVPGQPLQLAELAVLLRNKHYELPASEVEQLLFTRGGRPGRGDPATDELEALDILARIRRIADPTDGWRYFEKRNTPKHRAHFAAYAAYFGARLWRGVDPSLVATVARLLAWEPASPEVAWTSAAGQRPSNAQVEGRARAVA